MDSKSLLDQIIHIKRKYDEIERNTGRSFNIFSVANISADEKIICRIIKELIDPKGCHAQGSVYLKLFLENALKIEEEFTEIELENTVVKREKHIDKNRRIDLFISIPGRMDIPIEVKIYAGDQPAQCYDYAKEAKNSKLYYITLFGYEASEDSLRDLDKEKVENISFSKEIVDWLSECLKLPETIMLAPIREIIIQFIDVLKELTYQAVDKMEKEMLEIIMASEENFKSSELIAEGIKKAENKLYDSFFRKLHKKIWSKYNFELDEDYIEDEEYNKFGIYYLLKKIKKDIHLCLVISCERDNRIYAGVSFKNKDIKNVEKAKYIKVNGIIEGEWESSLYWIAWKYIENLEGDMPDFKNHNKAFYELLDENKMNDFVDMALKTVDELLSSITIDINVSKR